MRAHARAWPHNRQGNDYTEIYSFRVRMSPRVQYCFSEMSSNDTVDHRFVQCGGVKNPATLAVARGVVYDMGQFGSKCLVTHGHLRIPMAGLCYDTQHVEAVTIPVDRGGPWGWLINGYSRVKRMITAIAR
jgi:hypothetical protein